MNIHHTEYNQVIDGLRMQLTLQRRFSQEQLDGIKLLRGQVDQLHTILDDFRKDLKWRRETRSLTVFKDGDQWFAVTPDFKNLQESPSWSGKTPTAAITKALRSQHGETVHGSKSDGNKQLDAVIESIRKPLQKSGK